MEELKDIKFSVLMSIYYKEKPEYFEEAIKSIYEEQTLKPSEIILVQDGPLTEDLYKKIKKYKEKYKKILKVIPLEKNVGLGNALNIGLGSCTNEIVARMDTDDISKPDRFEKQIRKFREDKGLDILSSWVDEFIGLKENVVSQKRVPENHEEISKFIKRRNPINHPVSMFKKSSVINVGSYKPMHLNEDYYLWGRMFVNGSKFYNLQESLLLFRSENGFFKRRGGISYAKADIKLQKNFYSIKLVSLVEAVTNITIRVTGRIIPIFLRRKIYRFFLRKT